jgi:hypothetical protein
LEVGGTEEKNDLRVLEKGIYFIVCNAGNEKIIKNIIKL